MRTYVWLLRVLIAGVIAGGNFASTAVGNLGHQLVDRDALPPVDAELVIAVDVSYSMDEEELVVQREGYAQAVTSEEFLQALKVGPSKRLAVTYFEWSASDDQKIIVPWRLVDGPESADALAAEIMQTPVRRGSRTSISGAIHFAIPLFDQNRYHGLRRVIDISGDGANNEGPPVTKARNAAIEKGITINGLPIMMKRTTVSMMDIDNLDLYYEDCVIGGPGSFMLVIREREKFKEAIRTKLAMEVAGLTPAPRIVSVAESEPRVSCGIGEEIWERRSRW
ncbi:DUF1194 domain-containing protein [Bradyrhizobium sp. UFLA05-112]